MRIGGVITEFNPFHNGHAALCAGARAGGVTHLIAVMSGNFVQRGGLAITDKRVRAACALACGVDLVIELPLPWAMSGAQTFARGGVGLLAACGCVEVLTFGSESGQLEPLRVLAAEIDCPSVESRLRELLPQGLTYAKARELAAREVLGDELAGRLSSPNDLLGIEYLRAARATGWQPEVSIIKRLGVGHDAGRPKGGYASASYLRSVAGEGLAVLQEYIPPACLELLQKAESQGLYPADKSALEGAILAHLRRQSREELSRLPDLSEGLENRLYSAIRTAATTHELEAAVKTKRYTMARVRRLVLSAFLGVTQKNALGTPPYLRVVGLNERGDEILAKMKKTATLPVSSSLARLSGHSRRAGEVAALEERATDLYGLALPTPLLCGYEKTARVAAPRRQAK
ncbi:MAG: nucleotidyltransferase family protein [Oscillospiraceae bacterium]|nr:nucleotidyltransferase family protein [Oscillospiraceae bacterium]